MFYSQLLLSKKGALGSVWVAAHCPKRLKKDEIHQTDVSSSVDKILADGVPIATYRILAFLLLGVVRIYSKKVEFLFYECNNVLHNLCDINIKKRPPVGIRVWQTSRSVVLPKRFELDAFDLGLVDGSDITGGSTSSCDGIMLSDLPSFRGTSQGSLSKEKAVISKNRSKGHMDHGSPMISSRTFGSIEVLRGTKFLLADHPDPTLVPESGEEHFPLNPSTEYRGTSLPRFGTDQGMMFSLEDRLDPLILDETEKELIGTCSSDRNLNAKSNEMGEKSIHKSSDTEANFEIFDDSDNLLYDKPPEKELIVEAVQDIHDREDEHLVLDQSTDFSEPVDTNKRKFSGSLTYKRRKYQKAQESVKPVFVQSTPDLKLPGTETLEVVTIRSPAPTERSRSLKKRKIKFDQSIVLPLKVFKSWIDDSSDLVCKRRKVPHTPTQSRRANKLSDFITGFTDSTFPFISNDFGSSSCKNSSKASTGRLSENRDKIRSPGTPDVDKRVSDIQTPFSEQSFEKTHISSETPISLVSEKSYEQVKIAPGTPVTRSESLRSHDIGTVESGVVGPSGSTESSKELPFVGKRLDFDAFSDEEINSSEDDDRRKDGYSAMTRTIGRYLNKSFLDKKRRKEDEILNLSKLLARKRKKESSRIFYEILVLKTKDFVEVRQDEPYSDILLLRTPKLQQFSENDEILV